MPKANPRCRNCSSVSVLDHTEWASAVAAVVARQYHLRGQDREDVISAATLKLCEILARKPGDTPAPFDPKRHPPDADLVGAFRGFAYLSVRDASVNEAQRLRGGGTFHTVRPENFRTVPTLGDAVADLTTSDETPDDMRPVQDPPPIPTKSNTTYGRRLAGGAREAR